MQVKTMQRGNRPPSQPFFLSHFKMDRDCRRTYNAKGNICIRSIGRPCGSLILNDYAGAKINSSYSLVSRDMSGQGGEFLGHLVESAREDVGESSVGEGEGGEVGERGQVPWTQGGHRGGGEVEVLQGKENQVDQDQGERGGGEVQVVQGKGGDRGAKVPG